MPRCAHCGNDYDKAFQVTMADTTLTFDSFECAIHLLAPACSQCGCRILGHGLEADGRLYCCNHCAKGSGEGRLQDCA
jgi:hypothetical protein